MREKKFVKNNIDWFLIYAHPNKPFIVLLSSADEFVLSIVANDENLFEDISVAKFFNAPALLLIIPISSVESKSNESNLRALLLGVYDGDGLLQSKMNNFYQSSLLEQAYLSNLLLFQ